MGMSTHPNILERLSKQMDRLLRQLDAGPHGNVDDGDVIGQMVVKVLRELLVVVQHTPGMRIRHVTHISHRRGKSRGLGHSRRPAPTTAGHQPWIPMQPNYGKHTS